MNKRYVPNAFTCCNLICGCIATHFAFSHAFSLAFAFILLGAFFDFFDGFASRLLRVPSPMGIELDSLADCITFGLTPSAMLFTLFPLVEYPKLLNTPFWHTYLPYTAFLLAAFSAYRLAKFNLDERQHTSFIGMPTPACAIFWGALLSGSEPYLCSPMFNALFLLAFMLLFCFLLVCEIPMFSLKFKHYRLRDKENLVKYGFLAACAVILLLCAVLAPQGHIWTYLCRGVAACIGLYLLISIVLYFIRRPAEA